MYPQSVQLAGSFHCWFVKKYRCLVCVREKYYSGWKFTIVYDKPQPNEHAVYQSDYEIGSTTPSNEAMIKTILDVLALEYIRADT